MADGWESLLAAGGMNNEMLFSEYLEEDISIKGGHIGHLIPYLSGKLSATSYSAGDGIFNDLNNTITLYQERGIDIAEKDIKRGSWIAFFGSSYTYQFVWNFVNVFRGKNHDINPLQIGGFELPNTSFYMNIPGLSLKIRSAYNYKNWRFPISFETIINGDNRSEVGIKVERKIKDLSVKIGYIIGNKFEFETDLQYSIKDRIAISAGYTLYNRHNLNGQRLIPSVEKGDHDTEAFVSVSFLY